jgi:Na+/H+-dicarboxylate symporter
MKGEVMKGTLKNYRSSLILLSTIILGAVLGLIFGEDITFLKPFGDLFLNMLLVIIVPLIFLTISTSIGKMKQPKRIGKVLMTIITVFIITSLISVLVGFICTKGVSLVNSNDGQSIKDSLKITDEEGQMEEVNYLDKTVNTISVNNFQSLLSKDNIIALIVFSILVGIAINMAKEKGKATLDVLDSANEVIQKLITLIMYYAPIGLGCYFATLVGTFGQDIAIGYMKTFIIYIGAALFCYFALYSLYAYLAGGKQGFIRYWKSIVPATVTALATCSSAASIPINIKSARNIGIPEDIANTTIPLGTSFHKEGSIIGSVFKIMFLICLFNESVAVSKILLVSLLATLLVTAVPIGGGTISEMLIITMLGFPIGALPILTIIATIIDAPATALNVVGNTASSMMVSRVVDGKNWLKQK